MQATITPRTDPKWGQVYGDTPEPHYITEDGTGLWMWRKGQRVRFYDAEGNEHGVEQKNVCPAICFAAYMGWRDPSAPGWLNDATISEVRKGATFR